MADHRPSVELLESVHSFPGTYQIKAIGTVADDFEGRVLAAVGEVLAAPSDVECSARFTPDGRHVALTLDLTVQNAEQVRAIYDLIQAIVGLKLLL